MALPETPGLQFIRAKLALLSKLSAKMAAEKAFDLFITPQSRVEKELPPIFHDAESLQFLFEEHPIQGYRWNHPSPKKVLILHGYESSALNFDMYIEPLLQKGYEVLAFDAPAHGQSRGKQIHAIGYKNFILQILDTFGPVTSFITHSFGGLALSLTLEEQPHDNSWKVVLISPATETTTAINQFFSYMKLNASVRKEFDMLIEAANDKPAEWYSVGRSAASIKASVLFLQDKDDFVTPLSDVQPLIDKQYSNFTFLISEGLGHSKIYRDAATVNAIMHFL